MDNHSKFFTVTKPLIDLKNAVPGSRIEADKKRGEPPVLTVDGNREVIQFWKSEGFDLWVKKRKQDPFNNRKLWAGDVSFEQAKLFLEGKKKEVVLGPLYKSKAGSMK